MTVNSAIKGKPIPACRDMMRKKSYLSWNIFQIHRTGNTYELYGTAKRYSESISENVKLYEFYRFKSGSDDYSIY